MMIGSFTPTSRSAGGAVVTRIARRHHHRPISSAALSPGTADETRAHNSRYYFSPVLSQRTSAAAADSSTSAPPTTTDAIRRQSRPRGRRYYHEVSYDRFGTPPSSVLRYRQIIDGEAADAAALASRLNAPPPPPLDGDDGDGGTTVGVEMIMAPITPADVNLIGGTYPAGRPESFPAVGGTQSVGIVTHSSPSSGSGGGGGASPLKEGDMVVPSHPGIGTWRSSVVDAHTSNFLRVRTSTPRNENLDPKLACHLNNACTAFNLLSNFVDETSHPLGEGDVVVQNGGASGVGFMVGQIASARGAAVLSLVHRGRRTPREFEVLREHLKKVGRADEVLAEEDVTADGGGRLMREALSSLGGGGRVRIGLNCTGGPSSSAVVKCLGRDGVLVTYGGMSMRPVEIPTGLMIFKNIRAKGYWHTAWGDGRCREEREDLIERVANMMHDGDLVPPGFTSGPEGAQCRGRVFRLREVAEALEWVEGGAPVDAESGMRRRAYFDCSQDGRGEGPPRCC